jgi:hypothetical protein
MKPNATRRIAIDVVTDGSAEQCRELCTRIAGALPGLLSMVATPLAEEKRIGLGWRISLQRWGPAAGPPQELPDQRLADIELFAWLGEDEMGSGEIGLKQAQVPAGRIPMVATRKEKMILPCIVGALGIQAAIFKKEISLCRFTFSAVETALRPDPSPGP